MAELGWGYNYGDPSGEDGGYGNPYGVAGAVEIPANGVVPDDGGVMVVLRGEFHWPGYTVTVGGLPAYSGVSGQGSICRPYAGADGDTRLAFVVPAGLPLGPASISVFGGDGILSLADALTVVRRHRRGLFYLLNRLASPAGLHPARGPVEPSRESFA